MRLDLFVSGLILFSLGTFLIHIFMMMTDYITTIYPLCGYIGMGAATLGVLLLYIGIFFESREGKGYVGSTS